MKYTAICLAFILLACISSLDAAAKKKKAGKVAPEKHLQKVPATDPTAAQHPSILKDMRGVHPRLLLSREDFTALMEASKSDPLLKRHIDLILEQGHAIHVSNKDIKGMIKGASNAVVNALGRIPKLVFAHGLQPNEKSKQELISLLKLLVAEPYWDTTGELDCGMGGSCVMLLAALTFDMICDDLDPVFRKQAAQKLFTHARRMYYLGHKKLGFAKVKYWQPDPGNNHRWFRNKGLISCLLAVADEDGIEADWLLEQAKKEMDYVMQWYPEGGECHESVVYSNFGFAHLAFSVAMMDRIIGTNYCEHPGLKNAWELMIYSWSPSWHDNLSYGDAKNRGNSGWSKRSAFFIGPKLSRDPAAQGALKTYHNAMIKDGTGTWDTLCFYDSSVKTSPIEELPTTKLFADLGVAYMRDSWKAESPLMMFRCGPMGGYSMNAFRHSTDKIGYVNVAHNDPDANSFAFVIDGDVTSHPSAYDNPKITANHNTILIDGKGQIGEGKGWLQPIKNVDMRTMSYLTGWKQDDKGCAIVEGEAGGAYKDLDHFRRSSIWMPNEYVLIIDNVIAKKSHDIAWTHNSHAVEWTDEAQGRGIFQGKKGGAVPFHVLSNKACTHNIAAHTLFGSKGKLTLQKLSFNTQDKDARFVCLLNPWKRKDLRIDFEPSSTGGRITVTGDGINDNWDWIAAANNETPSSITGTRKNAALISLSKSDRAPHGDGHHAYNK